MQAYIGTKVIAAEPMTDVAFVKTVRALAQPADSFHPKAGYKVMYEDGYLSWSPADVFERAYRHLTPAEVALIETAQATTDPT